MSRDAAITRLRAEYADLHQEVMRRGRSGEGDFTPAMQRLQRREAEIITQLRHLGTGPYQ